MESTATKSKGEREPFDYVRLRGRVQRGSIWRINLRKAQGSRYKVQQTSLKAPQLRSLTRLNSLQLLTYELVKRPDVVFFSVVQSSPDLSRRKDFVLRFEDEGESWFSVDFFLAPRAAEFTADDFAEVCAICERESRHLLRSRSTFVKLLVQASWNGFVHAREDEFDLFDTAGRKIELGGPVLTRVLDSRVGGGKHLEGKVRGHVGRINGMWGNREFW